MSGSREGERVEASPGRGEGRAAVVDPEGHVSSGLQTRPLRGRSPDADPSEDREE